jgi:alpha/beta superfamily hydrolase
MEARSHLRVIDDLRGPAGRLEAVMNTGKDDAPYAVLIAHPHPLGGGTMHNKVVYHAAKAFSSFGLPVLRFNLRGVGLSEGVHDGGTGEIADVRAALDWLDNSLHRPILFAGFSFGSNVGFRACCGDARVRGLVALGLPIEAEGRTYAYDFLPACGTVPKLFLSGDHDPYGPVPGVSAAAGLALPPKQLVWIRGADHFFAGIEGSPDSKLPIMSETLRNWIERTFSLSPR